MPDTKSTCRQLTRAATLLFLLALLPLTGQSLRAQRAGAASDASTQPAPTPAAGASTQPASTAAELARLGSRGARAHDPSTIVKCGEEYWLFCTGPGVRSYRSRDLRQWEPGPRVFDELPAWTRRFLTRDGLWAPDVVRAADGRYLLYYSASSWGKNTSAMGLASNKTLDPADPAYRWVDQGIVIESAPENDFNAIDPAVTHDAEGKMWMSFGSFWSGIKLIELDPRTGKRIASDSPIHSLANKKEIEAPFIHRRGEKYYLFVNWGLCCRGIKSTYNIRVGRSDRITGPYLDKEGNDLRKGGGTLVLESDEPLIGPGHAGILTDNGRDWLSFHFYDATQRGRGTLGIRPITWSADGWPVVGAAEGGSQ